jgi:hypothetical protein
MLKRPIRYILKDERHKRKAEGQQETKKKMISWKKGK